MSIQVVCGECGKRLKVADTAAGKRGKCPACGAVVQVPPEVEHAHVPAPRPATPPQQVEAVPVQRVEAPAPQPRDRVPTVNVNIRRRTSSLGVAALILGIVAFLICWVPLIGMIGVPLSALGLLLGLVGLIVAVLRKGAGIGYPIAGIAVSGLALAVAFASTYAAGKAIEETAKAMSESVGERTRTNQQVVATADEDERHSRGPARTASDRPSRPEPTQPPAVVPKSPPEKPTEPEWASARDTVRQGDVGFRVNAALIGKVPLMAGFDRSETRSQDSLLAIEIELGNLSRSKKVEYHTWMGRDFSIEQDYATLEDNFGNRYKRIDFGFSTDVVGRTESDSIYPGKVLTDVLVFELPVDTIEYLNLELPAKNFGGTGMLRVRIPVGMLRRR